MALSRWLLSAVVILLTSFLTGCFQQGSSSPGASEPSSAETTSIKLSHQLTALHNTGLISAAQFTPGQIIVPGTPPRLTSIQSGPFDLSDGRQVTFNIIHSSISGEVITHSVAVSGASALTPTAVSESEIAQEISAQTGDDILVTTAPLAINGAGEGADGSTLELVQVSGSDFTLTDLGFPGYNRINTGTQQVTSADYIFNGTLHAHEINSAIIRTYDWSVYIDKETFTAQSNQTLDIPPGDWDFSLLVENNGQQYAAQTQHTVTETTQTIPMTVSPVIGEQTLNFTVSGNTLPSRLTRYHFLYPVTAIPSLPHPISIGISVDDQPEEIFNLNPSTGLSDMYIDLNPGPQNLKLSLYSASVLIGRSLPDQEHQTVTAGQNITMDIAPLSGEVNLQLTENGGDAILRFTIPPEIDAETDNPTNVVGKIKIIGPETPLKEVPFTSPIPPEGIIIPGVKYDNVVLSIDFEDSQSGDILGTCSVDWNITPDSGIQNCQLNLRSPSLISGNVYATVGLNVVNANGEPVSGVVIRDQNDNLIGITGSSVFGTPGYLKLHTLSGSHTFYGNNPAALEEGEVTITANALDVITTTMVISQPPHPVTCASVLADNPSSPSGLYFIDPDGDQPPVFGSPVNEPFRVYCDMTTNGGGWALFATAEGNLPINPGTAISPDGPSSVLMPEQWQVLRDHMADGMMMIDEHNNISVISYPILTSANCISPLNVGSLTSLTQLYMSQPSGDCNDASGSASVIYLESNSPFGASLYQGTPGTFTVWPYAGNDSSAVQNKLQYYIK